MGYELQRFKDAQAEAYPNALAEIRAGRKTTHWIWYVFPQLQDLGRSQMAHYYGMVDLGEAKAYLADEVLRSRLIEISSALLGLDTSDPVLVLGRIDALKVRSCMTLFACCDNTDPVFVAVLDKFYDGTPDELTLELVGLEAIPSPSL